MTFHLKGFLVLSVELGFLLFVCLFRFSVNFRIFSFNEYVTTFVLDVNPTWIVEAKSHYDIIFVMTFRSSLQIQGFVSDYEFGVGYETFPK